jgi:ComF family protein
MAKMTSSTFVIRDGVIRARGVLGAWCSPLLEFALPQRCPVCGAVADPARLLCDTCFAAVPRLAMPLCARCLARERDGISCRAHAGFEVWSAWVYDERAAEVVQALKFAERFALAAALAPELARALPPVRFDLVLAVPLHRSRERERGYNQAAALADALAARIHVPRLDRALERVRATRPQTRMGAAARRANLRDAFRARVPRSLEGRAVLLVDDVMTTGATLEACLATLRDAGARATGVTLAWAQ